MTRIVAGGGGRRDRCRSSLSSRQFVERVGARPAWPIHSLHVANTVFNIGCYYCTLSFKIIVRISAPRFSNTFICVSDIVYCDFEALSSVVSTWPWACVPTRRARYDPDIDGIVTAHRQGKPLAAATASQR